MKQCRQRVAARAYFFFAFFVVFFLALALDAFFFAGMDNLLLVCGTLGSVCLRRDSPRPPINHGSTYTGARLQQSIPSRRFGKNILNRTRRPSWALGTIK